MPDDIIEREVLGEANRACDVLVDRVRGRVARQGGATAAELSQYAASAFEAYAETLLRAILAVEQFKNVRGIKRTLSFV